MHFHKLLKVVWKSEGDESFADSKQLKLNSLKLVCHLQNL